MTEVGGHFVKCWLNVGFTTKVNRGDRWAAMTANTISRLGEGGGGGM